MKLKRSKLVSQGSINRLVQRANESWNQKKFQDAIEYLERASRFDPANVSILVELANYFGMRYEYDTAERLFEKAVSIAPDKAATLALAAVRCGDFGNYGMSERFFLRAIEQQNATPKIYAYLATLYERLRQLDKAADMIERALYLDSKHPHALLIRGRLEKQNGHIEIAERTIRFALSLQIPDVWVHAQAWYELGLILDRQGRYDEAMQAFAPAKILLHPQSKRFRAELKVVRQRIQLMHENLSIECLQKWLNEASEFVPCNNLALLGGHPRSGTTLLEQVLDTHTNVTSLEETQIFHDDAYMPLVNRMPEGTPILSILEAAPVASIQNSRLNYFRSAELFRGNPVGNHLLIDKNPSLTFLIPAMIRIFPEIKLLIALRDPRDVVLSCYMQPLAMSQGSSAYLYLGGAVDDYVRMMDLWLKIKPMIPGHYIEVHYENMIEDLEPIAKKTLNFLGVAWDKNVLKFDAHARTKAVRSPTYADVTQPVYKRSKGRWRNYQKYLEPYLDKLEPYAKNFGYE